MARKKKIQEPENKENAKEIIEDKVNEPGDCIGHWLDGDESCEICEIQDSCKDMTSAIGNGGETETKEDK